MFEGTSAKYPNDKPKLKAKSNSMFERVKSSKFGRLYRSISHEGSLFGKSSPSPAKISWPDPSKTKVLYAPSTPNLLSPTSSPNHSGGNSPNEIGTPTRSASQIKRFRHRKWAFAPPTTDLGLFTQRAALQPVESGFSELIKLVEEHMTWTTEQEQEQEQDLAPEDEFKGEDPDSATEQTGNWM